MGSYFTPFIFEEEKSDWHCSCVDMSSEYVVRVDECIRICAYNFMGGYKKDEYDIEIEESNLSGEEEDTIRCYAQGVYDADKQLKMLYDYIQTLDEPTLLIFYGDHLPYLKTESSDDITKHLDYFNTEDDILNYYRSYLDLRPSEHGRVTELYPERIRQFGLMHSHL